MESAFAELDKTTIGNPLNEKVRMGSLAGQSQQERGEGAGELVLATSKIVYGSLEGVNVVDADSTRGHS